MEREGKKLKAGGVEYYYEARQRFEDIPAETTADDFVYLAPLYIGCHTEYYNTWNEAEAEQLAGTTQALPYGFALSMWLENQYCQNEHVAQCWSNCEQRVCSHFYHVGSGEDLRHAMNEALLIKPGFATPGAGKQQAQRERMLPLQVTLALE